MARLRPLYLNDRLKYPNNGPNTNAHPAVDSLDRQPRFTTPPNFIAVEDPTRAANSVPGLGAISHRCPHAGADAIAVFLDTPWTMVLSSEGEQTLQGLIGSTKALIETTAKHLLDFWQWRRNHPASLCPPPAQWQEGRSTKSTGFDGYARGTLELAPGMAIVHPDAENTTSPLSSEISVLN